MGGEAIQALSEDEAAALLRACADPYERAAVGLLIEGGLRPREVCALRTGNLRRDAIQVWGKDGRKRTVKLGLQLSESLQVCLRERGTMATSGGPLLLAADKRPMDMWALGEAVRAVAQRAGFTGRLSVHMLRATAAMRRWRDVKPARRDIAGEEQG